MSDAKTYLFLQGPHGPFFRQLSDKLRDAGATVWRAGFNAGDAAFWGRAPGYIAYRGNPADWPQELARLIAQHDVTDIVLYGDTRPAHAEAVRQAKHHGLRVHVFEEGYLRPYWVTYERGGSNGHSRLMDLSLPDMQDRLARSSQEMPTPPSHWGDMRQHIFYGAAYHWFVMFANKRYPGFQSHRALPVHREALLYSKRLFLMPFQALHRRWATRRIMAGGFPYHIALLQLEHDASFQAHSDFASMADFIAEVISGFAIGAPGHHHLVFKAHPLESGQSPLRKLVWQYARQHGIADRTHFLRGGKLAQILDGARSAVTVNSTSGQQALWRGIPLKAFGAAVFAKPEFMSNQPLPAFFANPQVPDTKAYRDYRQFLLETSQVPGGFYSATGRQQLLRELVDKMLDPADPYDAVLRDQSPLTATLRVVRSTTLP